MHLRVSYAPSQEVLFLKHCIWTETYAVEFGWLLKSQNECSAQLQSLRVEILVVHLGKRC